MSGKQAVLLIHGIGEQRPMETLRGFVDAVWTTDQKVHHANAEQGLWSKPDTISGSFELRRLTTSKDKNGVLTDFFEFYWAHLMEGNSALHVLAWAKVLLLRSPASVPKALRGAWIVLVLLALVLALFAIFTALPASMVPQWMPAWVSGLAGVVFAILGGAVVRNVVGDAARYLHPAPTNVKRRQEIRAKGVELLTKLHDAKSDSGEPTYDRIIVVGHSLGSVIGYDVLTYAWALYHRTNQRMDNPVLDAIENAIVERDFDRFRELQPRLMTELKENGNTWRVTDFVTAGSPLSHAAILLAKDGKDLASKQQSREFPMCPPVLEKERMFSYPTDRKRRWLHHAAVFGPCRWSNLYFPARRLFWGDLVGGPLRPVFGEGIIDHAVETNIRGGLLSHTLYWSQKGQGTAIELLRTAVNLLSERSEEE